MKKALFLLLIVIISGCEQFETKKISSEEILSEETRELNWNDVDQYPAFRECREITEVEAAKTCFGNKVASYIYARLEEKRPVISESLEDTLLLHLTISDKGVPAIDSMEIDSIVTYHLPEIRTWLRESLDSLPTIYPASKRGIPVSTKFRMPIVIKAE